eukprot:6959704-Prymnesium_polylepis.2
MFIRPSTAEASPGGQWTVDRVGGGLTWTGWAAVRQGVRRCARVGGGATSDGAPGWAAVRQGGRQCGQRERGRRRPTARVEAGRRGQRRRRGQKRREGPM